MMTRRDATRRDMAHVSDMRRRGVLGPCKVQLPILALITLSKAHLLPAPMDNRDGIPSAKSFVLKFIVASRHLTSLTSVVDKNR